MPLTQVRGGGIANDAVSATHIATGAVTVTDIPDGEITHAKMANDSIDGDNIVDDVALPGNPTTTTQSSGNNTTRIATTAFVTTAVGAISQDAIVTPQAAQNTRAFSTGNNHLMAGDVTIGENQTYTLSGTAKLIIIG